MKYQQETEKVHYNILISVDAHVSTQELLPERHFDFSGCPYKHIPPK